MPNRISESQFWQKVADSFNLYHGRYRRAILTDKDMQSDIREFLSDIDTLASAWYSQDMNGNKEGSKQL